MTLQDIDKISISRFYIILLVRFCFVFSYLLLRSQISACFSINVSPYVFLYKRVRPVLYVFWKRYTLALLTSSLNSSCLATEVLGKAGCIINAHICPARMVSTLSLCRHANLFSKTSFQENLKFHKKLFELFSWLSK